METLEQFYSTQVFECIQCRKENVKILNPYLDLNHIIHSESEDGPVHRRAHLNSYLDHLNDIKIMFIGEAPGIYGCGYSGIPFTDQYHMVNDLQIENRHPRVQPLQQEHTASSLYRVFQRAAQD